MRFAEADAAHEDDVGFVFEEGQAKEVLHLGAVDFLGPVPVKLVEGFDDRGSGRRRRGAGWPVGAGAGPRCQ